MSRLVQHFVTAVAGHVFAVLEGVACCTGWDLLGVGVGVGVGVDDDDDDGVAVEDDIWGLIIDMLGVETTTIVDQLGTVMAIDDEEGRTLIVFTGNIVGTVGVDKEVGRIVNEFKKDVAGETVGETGFIVPPCTVGLLMGAIVGVCTTVTVSKPVTVAIATPPGVAVADAEADVGHSPSIGTFGK